MTPDSKSILESWLDAIEARSVERITDVLADDVVLETELIGRPITGKQVLSDMLVGAMDAYESIRIDRRKIVASGRDVAALLTIHARFGADLEMFGETFSTAGKELHIAGALFAEVNEVGKIARIMRVRDTLGVVQQLGLSPERVDELMKKLEAAMKEPPSRAA